MRLMVVLSVIFAAATPAWGSSFSLSFAGSLATPENYFSETFSLSSSSTLTVQTWGFGGGTNAAGTVIAPGGFDPLVALFSGPVASAVILTNGAGDAYADADSLASSVSFVGNCPPAGTVTIGTGAGSAVCGDDKMVISGLAAGTYTLVLSDANYLPLAVNPGPPASSALSDGFTDLTGGAFQTCNVAAGGLACITTTSNFAVDLVSSSANLAVPEPGSLVLCGLGLAAVFGVGRWVKRNDAC